MHTYAHTDTRMRVRARTHTHTHAHTHTHTHTHTDKREEGGGEGRGEGRGGQEKEEGDGGGLSRRRSRRWRWRVGMGGGTSSGEVSIIHASVKGIRGTTLILLFHVYIVCKLHSLLWLFVTPVLLLLFYCLTFGLLKVITCGLIASHFTCFRVLRTELCLPDSRHA